MAEVFVPIMSVKQYFKQYAVEGIAKGADPNLVKKQLLDAFQKEIFGQITMKYHDAYILSKGADEVPEDVRKGVDAILQNSLRKWRRLCMMFGEYSDTRMVIEPQDLVDWIGQIIDDQKSPEVLETEDGPELVVSSL